MSEPASSTKCVQPAAGPLLPPAADAVTFHAQPAKEGIMPQVGKPAPDFEASAFIDGAFKNIKLSDYKGRWVLLCFYPGDFTFV